MLGLGGFPGIWVCGDDDEDVPACCGVVEPFFAFAGVAVLALVRIQVISSSQLVELSDERRQMFDTNSTKYR